MENCHVGSMTQLRRDVLTSEVCLGFSNLDFAYFMSQNFLRAAERRNYVTSVTSLVPQAKGF